MKFCQSHWDELKAAIDARGLTPLVSKDGPQAHARMVGRLRHEDERAIDYDPLMAAYFGIINRALGIVGLIIMQPNEDGTDRCPLCFLIESCQCGFGERCHYRGWIPSVADYVYKEAKEKGLVIAT